MARFGVLLPTRRGTGFDGASLREARSLAVGAETLGTLVATLRRRDG